MANNLNFNSYDEILKEIYSIKNIESIKIYDLTFGNGTRSNIQIVPTIFITYDGGKNINLCAKDKYFDIFFKKVYEVYKKESTKEVLDQNFDILKIHSKIEIDEGSKNILEKGNIIDTNDIYALYDKSFGYDKSLLFSTDKLYAIMPIIKYHLKKLINKSNNKNISFYEDKLVGYKNKFSLDIMLDNKYSTLLIDFKEIGNNYYLKLKCLDGLNDIDMQILFNSNSLTIKNVIEREKLINISNYKIDEHGINVIEEIVKNGLTLEYKKYDILDNINNYPNLTGLDELDNYKWYKLPWNSLYGINYKEQNLSDTEIIREYQTKYVDVSKSFLEKEFFMKIYERKSNVLVNGYKITLEDMAKNIYGISLFDKIYLIETSFLDKDTRSGYYESYLESKFFYHLARGTLKTINKNHLIKVGKVNNIFDKCDFLDEEYTRKLVKGK